MTTTRRTVLAAAASKSGALPIVELPRNRRQTACCGAGGGRMWFDDPPAERVGQGRIREIAESGADTVAVACPFCLIMLKRRRHCHPERSEVPRRYCHSERASTELVEISEESTLTLRRSFSR